MSEKLSRISKWRKYREAIDSNESIHFSIANTDKEIKELLESINFNIEEHYDKFGFTNSELKEPTKKKIRNEIKEIETILSTIEKNETVKTKDKLVKDFNSHKYDEIINTNFLEFLDKEELDLQSQETTDLKINKINISINKD